MEKTTYLNEENFEEILAAKNAAVVDFYADWCGPCKAMTPIFDALAAEMADKIGFYKVNVDQNRNLAIQNRVLGIPCFLFFKEGRMVKRVDGAMSEEDFREALKVLE